MNREIQLKENYKRINHIAAKCLRILILFLAVAFVFSIFVASLDFIYIVLYFSLAIIFAIIPTIIISVLKFDTAPYIKHVVIFCSCVVVTIMIMVLNVYAIPLILLPVLISSLYFDKTLVLFTTLLMTAGVLISTLAFIKIDKLFLKLSFYDNADVFSFFAVPNIVVLFGVSFVAYAIVERNSMMVNTAIDIASNVNENQKGLIFSFAEISESKSKFTGEHIKRVAEYMKIMGEAAGFDYEYIEKLSNASMMHDIGKLMISEEILDKPDKLSDEEYQIMRSHVHYGEALLRRCPGEMMEIARILALEHHEKWDGTGYLGLKKEEISYIGRLMALCDVFDALTSDRYYKKERN